MTPHPDRRPEIPGWLPAGAPPPGGGPRLETPGDYLDYYEALGLTLIRLGRDRPWMSDRIRKLAAKMPVSLGQYFFPRLCAYARLRRRPEWLASSNFGIRTGKRYNLVVIDLDDLKSGEALVRECRLPPTLAARTGGGGFHLYYRIPESCRFIASTHDCVARGIDVRGEYSFCTAPPSRHGSGGRYVFIHPAQPIADLPEAAVARFHACGISRFWHIRKFLRNYRFLQRQIVRDYFCAVLLRKPPAGS